MVMAVAKDTLTQKEWSLYTLTATLLSPSLLIRGPNLFDKRHI